MTGRLILASASPRRAALLAQIGICPDETVAADIDESATQGELPRQTAQRLAEMKARTVSQSFPDDYVLGADTVVACGRRLLDKAEDEAMARRHLKLLSGRRHRVHGGICIIAPGGRAHERLVTTQVSFKRLTEAEIGAYLTSAEWRGKAGAYAIQGRAGGFVKSINGSYGNVVGLALYETLSLLEGIGMSTTMDTLTEAT